MNDVFILRNVDNVGMKAISIESANIRLQDNRRSQNHNT